MGVMYLAGEMMDHLMENWPGCASQVDKLCLMIAGLCHDLGHGPFRFKTLKDPIILPFNTFIFTATFGKAL